MSELLAIWREVADGFTERLAAVGPQEWSAPTGCPDWDVNQLVNHAIGAQRMIPKALGAAGAIDATGDDLVRVWGTVRAAADVALSAPGALDETVELPFGTMKAGDGLGFPLSDLLVHTWDLARAVHADDRLVPEACTMALANLVPIDELLRSPGFYGPKLEPAVGADDQDKLLAFLGRPV
ncbi:MAG: TIGR03086 family metal-binding protein [Acidimicrobiales bacterium]|jgi:uncharacterized protein (TIGR03086 family)